MFSNALKSFSSNISANYHEKSTSPVSQCGAWKIYDAKKKKTNQPASIWVFERKLLENSASGSGMPLRGGGSSREGLRAAQDEVVERLKHEAGLLARLRHPCILELVEPVEETRSGGLQFVTEPVTGSLMTLLKEKDEEERNGGSRYVQNDDGRRRRREVEIDELEIQKGLLQVGKALEFLHESANLIHGNLTPDALIVNTKSDWKLCGLGLTVNSTNPPLPPPFDPRLPPHVQLQLDYAAPDLILDQTFSTSCDLFSLGVLIVALYNYPHRSPIESHNSHSTYRKLLSSQQSTPNASNNFLSARPIPRQLTGNVLPQLITRRPAGRMNARDFQQSEYFDNILVSTLRFLDQFPAKTPSEKAAFMRGLPKILSQFPRSVLEKKILPGLVEELRDGSMLALVLPNIFQIVEAASSRMYSEKVLKRLKEVFIPTCGTVTSASEPKTAAAKIAERERETGKEGGLTVILSKMGIIKDKTTAQEFKEDVLPLVFLALESPTHALQDMALRSLPVILPKLDFPTLKNDLFPVVASVFTKTSSLGIKIRGLEAFRVLCGGTGSDLSDGLDGFSNSKPKSKGDEAPILDKYTVQEKMIPLLKGIKTKEPAVMMEALSVFREVGKICDREIVAMDILPTLWAMSFGPLLGLEQFKSFMEIIKSLTQKIEAEQIRKLQELSSSAPGGQSAGDFLSFGGTPGLHGMNRAASPGAETDFERLVYGKKDGAQAPVSDGFSWQSTASVSANGSYNPTPTTPAPTMKSRNPAALTTGAQKFSWSTPNPTSATRPPVASMNSVLGYPQNPSLNSVSALQPTSLSTLGTGIGMGFSTPPIQPKPSTGGFGSTTAFRQSAAGNNGIDNSNNSNIGGGLDWSTAMKPKPSFPTSNSRPGSTPPTNQPMSHMNKPMNQMNKPMNQMAQPMNQMMSGLALGGTSNTLSPGLVGFGATGPRKGGGIQLTNFGIGAPKAAPAAAPNAFASLGGSGGSFSMGAANAPKKSEEKTEMDKWESLI